MSSDWTVRAEGLSKKFSLTLQNSMLYGVKDSLCGLVGLRLRRNVLRSGEFWAVKDVSFELRRGESLGIMGVNGSGKTTLLRLLNGILAPDVGRVSLRGRVGALIAAGAGFGPVLTGRENVYVNGSLLGMTKREIDARMDEIIAFAGLGQFIDTAVKHYSSGMIVRLGFAVAAMSKPEILLIDEVLAVGDLNFQKKCYDYLHRLRRNGTTIVLVSHSIGAIWALCEKGILLHAGEVKVDGPSEEVIRAYNDQNASAALTLPSHEDGAGSKSNDDEELPPSYGGQKGGTGEAIVRKVWVRSVNSNGPQAVLEFGSGFVIEALIDVKEAIADPLFRYTIDAVHYKYVACLDSIEQGLYMGELRPGRYQLRVNVPQQNFRPGTYTVNLAICRKAFPAHVFYWFGPAKFQILHPNDKFLYADENAIVHLSAFFTLSDDGSREIAASSSIPGRPGESARE
jgi:lipopolysaccharide transport system ATP-binding protein